MRDTRDEPEEKLESWSRRARPVVAILGGGVSGAATAFHLAGLTSPGEVEIVVVEPRPALGRGLAYSTDDPTHRVNVPAARMTLIAETPEHFIDWLAAERIRMSPGTLTLRGDYFPERRIFGQYMSAQLEPYLASGAIRHARASAVAVARTDGHYRVTLSDKSAIEADFVVLAMTHPNPRPPRALDAVAGSPRVFADPYDTARIATIDGEANVLVVGTGLTAADIVASITARVFRGRITCLSRHGLRSRGHGVVARASGADFAAEPERSAVGLLRRVRRSVADDAAEGQSWHATLDRVREQGAAIWAGLDPASRRRIVRHLRRFWDVHRFRIAPQIEEVLDATAAAGRLSIVAASLVDARETEAGIVVDYRPRGGAAVVAARFDAVVVTTGPNHADVARSNPVLRGLGAEGLLCPDPLGLGIHVADDCHAVGADGNPSETLLVAGPLARGHVGELMGIPEVTRHGERVARTIARRIKAEACDGAPGDRRRKRMGQE